MGSLPRSRRPAPEPHALTVAPFDAAGVGVGDVPPTMAIDTPDPATALIVFTQPARTDDTGSNCCIAALDAFRKGYEETGGQVITTALIAGIEAANHTLSAPRHLRDGRQSGVGLIAIAVRGPDAFVIQAGPGQVLVAAGDHLIALPPLRAHMRRGDAPDTDHAPALGLTRGLEPDLFHIDASGGLCVALCHNALAPFLGREDDRPLRSGDARVAATYLVHLGERHHVSETCGVVVSAGATEDIAPVSPPRAQSAPWATPAHAPRSPRPAPRVDSFTDDDGGNAGFARETARNEGPLASRSFPRGPALSPTFSQSPADHHRPTRFDDTHDIDTDEWNGNARSSPSPPREDARRQAGPEQVMGMPMRLAMFVVAVVCTLAILVGIMSVRAWNGHQANVRAIQQLDDIEGDRAHAEVIAQHDSRSAYAILEPLVARLDAVARSGRQTRRVQQEQTQLTKTLDLVSNVTRVVPRQAGQLDHFDGAVGNHRLLLLGDDGQLYLYDHDERGNWALYRYDAVSGRRGAPLFTQGQMAIRNPAGELRGLMWSGGLATSDRTRLFIRTATGAWAEVALGSLSERRPAAVVMANDTLYLLDNVAGVITRVSLRDSIPAKAWTSEGAVADLKTAVDLATDGQTIWVLLADGRVRGFAGNGTGAALFTLSPLPPLKGMTAITTSAASSYLYIAEGNGERVLRVRKTDGKLVQVLRSTGDLAPTLDTVQSMAVDESHGMLWCVTADGVLSFPLPPVVS